MREEEPLLQVVFYRGVPFASRDCFMDFPLSILTFDGDARSAVFPRNRFTDDVPWRCIEERLNRCDEFFMGFHGRSVS